MKRWYFDIRRVEQEDDHGCGIACVATACGTTYERARAEFFPRREKFIDDESLHVDAKRILGAVRKLGFSAIHVPTFRVHKRPAIVVFSWHPGCSWTQHHGVVWDPWQKKFIDPGYDHDLNHDNDFYLDKWKQSGFKAIVITGRRH